MTGGGSNWNSPIAWLDISWAEKMNKHFNNTSVKNSDKYVHL